jgi:hypothetical protein
LVWFVANLWTALARQAGMIFAAYPHPFAASVALGGHRVRTLRKNHHRVGGLAAERLDLEAISKWSDGRSLIGFHPRE